MKWMISLLVLIAGVHAGLAEDAGTTAEKKYNAAVEQAKKEFVAVLKTEMTRLTIAGDLDGALKIKNKIAALDVASEASQAEKPVKPVADSERAEWKFGSKENTARCKAISDQDGAFEEANYKGQPCAKMGGSYLYVDVDKDWSSEWIGKESLEVEIEYATEAPGRISLNYDSSDAKYANPSFKAVKDQAMTVGTWKTVVFKISDPLFQKGGNGHDFRICSRPNVYISRITLRRVKKTN